MQIRRFLSTTLAALTLLSMLAACAGDNSPAAETTAPPSASTTVSTAEAETTADPYALPQIPTDLRFANETFTFLDVDGGGYYGAYWNTYDIFAADMTGDTINDAVYRRNLSVEERFGLKIGEIKVSDVAAEIDRAFNAQIDEYDAVIGNLSQMSSMTTKRYLTELSTIPYLDLTQSWWDQNQLRDMAIANKCYYATGDLMVIDNDATFALMFNKQMAKDNQLGDLYAMVDAGKWTFEQMELMVSKTTRDLNGDTAIQYQDDQLGISSGVISIEALFYGAGMTQTAKDVNDLPVLSLNTDKLATFIGKAYALAVNPEQCFNYNIQIGGSGADIAKDLFTEYRALFYGETLQGVTRLRSSDVDFGIIPYPKWDETQQNYLSHQVSVGSSVAIPVTNQNLEMAGAVLESLAAKGQQYLTPAYYDTVLIGRGLRDAESEPMVALILANRVYDLGYVYNWGQFHTNLRTLVQSNQPNVGSTLKITEKLFATNMKKTLDAIGAAG